MPLPAACPTTPTWRGSPVSCATALEKLPAAGHKACIIGAMDHHTLAATLLLAGAVLIAMALAEQPVRRLPLSAALIYFALGWAGAALLRGTLLDDIDPQGQASLLMVCTEWAVLISLFAVGLRVRLLRATAAWRAALLLASVGMVATIAMAAALAHVVLGLSWAAAVLLGSVLAPTDPVLASEVQIRSPADRDAVRLSLTAEGGMNDGTAFPMVMLALGWLGLRPLGEWGSEWLLRDLLWLIGGGALIGWAVGRGVGWAIERQIARGHGLAWDELLFIGVVALGYGVANLLAASAFVAVFVAGVVLFVERPRAAGEESAPSQDSTLSRRLQDFGARVERLVEVAMVLVIGASMVWVQWDWRLVVFALGLIGVVRPLAVWLTVRRHMLPHTQRRLVGWFGIRGVGAMYYLAFALAQGLEGDLAQRILSASLACIAASIVLHGVSATPLMARYHKRRAH
jgi:NhaP-type Na+/H+ or K+/H+ antiporter